MRCPCRTEVGKMLMQQCASSVKNLSLELGGWRAIHCLRRRRHRAGNQGRRLRVRKWRVDLRLRQPDFGVGRWLRHPHPNPPPLAGEGRKEGRIWRSPGLEIRHWGISRGRKPQHGHRAL